MIDKSILIILGGCLWFAIFVTVGFSTPSENKWGSDAFENYHNQHKDMMRIFTFVFIGFVGFMCALTIGGMLGLN